MYWDRPAQSITTGFGSRGQGRHEHSLEPRILTLHEAARVQFMPDLFASPEQGRQAVQHMIGNAVPAKMACAVCLELFR